MDASQAGQANNSSDFVRKLYKMLEAPQDESVVRWGNEGDSFVVLENEKFTKHILPKHFKHSNFASFVRQLNKYDFHKVRHNNEEGGSSPYGTGAWEFKHPDFKVNNKDALDNIRRKAPAPRKANPLGEDLLPTQQVDLINTQLVATQQQLHQLQERYNELSMHHSMLVQELIGVQKTVVNHEHVMQYVMNFLNSLDAQRRRESRTGVSLFPPQEQAPPRTATTNTPTTTTTTTTAAATNGAINFDDDAPASPLQHASKLLSDINADNMLNSNKLEQLNEQHMRMNATFATPPPLNGNRSSSRGAGPHSAGSSTTISYTDLDNMVYPIGTTQGIDPMYSEHVHNIPYSMPPKAVEMQQEAGPGRKRSMYVDPGWIRQPQILLVEDDQTCRRIGGKFLFAFNCTIDSALDGMEAVDKLSKGTKYDLVLMDIIMPNLDGVSATHLIRQYDSHTPIVAMTSNIRSDDIAMYFQHGMNDVLPKPFTKEGLLNMLEKHLAHLKKPTADLGISAHPGSILPQKRSLKSDDSPGTSPAGGSSWTSPSNMTGLSPQSTHHDDPYMQAVHNTAGPPPYGLQPHIAVTNAAAYGGPAPNAALNASGPQHRGPPGMPLPPGPMQRPR